MKKVKTDIKRIIPIILLIIMVISLTAFANEDTKGMPVYSILKADFTIDDFVQEGYDENFVNKLLSDYGWIFRDDYMYRTTRIQFGDIELNGTNYTIDDNGLINFSEKQNMASLSINGIADDVYITDEPVEITTKDSEILMHNPDTTSQSNSAIVVELNFGDLMDLMDQKEEEAYKTMGIDFSPPPHGQKKYSSGDYVHCNRFNGPATDHYHYKNTSPKAIVNFAGSDCDYSLGNSLFCITTSNCNQLGSGSRGACSTFTIYRNSGNNCPKTYHHHNFGNPCRFSTVRYNKSKWPGKAK